ncbi:MAG TPA: hypothetical protein VN641_17560, partial [Urbifossiella sp.]|nr:hypothetical protein [Urbifossiella sp.]
MAMAIVAGALLHSAFSHTFNPSSVLALLLAFLAAVGFIVNAAARQRADSERIQAALRDELASHAEELGRQRDEAKLLESAVVHTRNGV